MFISAAMLSRVSFIGSAMQTSSKPECFLIAGKKARPAAPNPTIPIRVGEAALSIDIGHP
jgi:hypothetical protein